MNRLEQLLPTLPQTAISTSTVDSARVVRTEREDACSLFIPLHYEENYAYPLLIWLHGPGDNDDQLKRIMPLVSMRNYVAVAPRGFANSAAGRNSTGHCAWEDSTQYAAEIEQRIAGAIIAARRKSNIAEQRIFIGGFGSGGTTALRIALCNPRRFAGVLSLCGGLPQGRNPLAKLDQLRQLPVFLACGQFAARYCMDAVCDDLRLLHSAGMTVSLRVYPCGDELSTYMLPDMDRWIMDQISTTQAVIKD